VFASRTGGVATRPGRAVRLWRMLTTIMEAGSCRFQRTAKGHGGRGEGGAARSPTATGCDRRPPVCSRRLPARLNQPVFLNRPAICDAECEVRNFPSVQFLFRDHTVYLRKAVLRHYDDGSSSWMFFEQTM